MKWKANTNKYSECRLVMKIPELSIGFPAGTDSGSLMSTTTTSDVRKVLATEAACSKQHLTTCFIHKGKLDLLQQEQQLGLERGHIHHYSVSTNHIKTKNPIMHMIFFFSSTTNKYTR